MLNFLRPFFARLFNPVVQALARTPVTPNMITVAGTVGVAAAALSMFPIGELFPGAFTATVFIFTDMLDGQLARIKGGSGVYGAFLDSTMDRFGDAAIFGGITIWFMRTDHLLACVSLFCLAAGLCVSYVKARAEGLGLNANVGLIERPERHVRRGLVARLPPPRARGPGAVQAGGRHRLAQAGRGSAGPRGQSRSSPANGPGFL